MEQLVLRNLALSHKHVLALLTLEFMFEEMKTIGVMEQFGRCIYILHIWLMVVYGVVSHWSWRMGDVGESIRSFVFLNLC